MLGAFWSTNFSFLVYSKLARDLVSENEQFPRKDSSDVLWSPCTHEYILAHTQEQKKNIVSKCTEEEWLI